MISKEEFKDRIKKGKLKSIKALKYPYQEGIILRWTLYGYGGMYEMNNLAGEFCNNAAKLCISVDKAYDLIAAGFFECTQKLPEKERKLIRDDYQKARMSVQVNHTKRTYI